MSARRFVAGVAGLGLALVGVWGTLVVLLSAAITAQHPDPTKPNGDPCCAVPDTWDEVAIGAVSTAATAVVDGLIIAAAAALVWWALKARWPRPRVLLMVPALEAVASVAVVVVALGAVH